MGKEEEACLEVFVKGFSEKTTEEALKKHFEGCGEIKNVKLPKNDDDEVKGFAFITFAHSDAADKAVELDGEEFGDSGAIEVRLAKQKGKGKGKGKDKGKGKGKGKGKKGKWGWTSSRFCRVLCTSSRPRHVASFSVVVVR